MIQANKNHNLTVKRKYGVLRDTINMGGAGLLINAHCPSAAFAYKATSSTILSLAFLNGSQAQINEYQIIPSTYTLHYDLLTIIVANTLIPVKPAIVQFG